MDDIGDYIMKKGNKSQTSNPITNLDYPDPDVIRVGDTYYMVSTTMHFMPGCEILRSYDLINWEHMTYVYDRLDSTDEQSLRENKNCYGKGMWAASLRYHKGKFYICFAANDTQKTYLYTAENIEGPWYKQLVDGFYHDCSLLFDDDDRVYIVSGNTDIRLQELKSDLSGPKEGGLDRIIVSDKGNPQLGYEGSHFYKINGKYYLFLIHSLRDRWMRTEACYVSDSLTGKFIGGDVLCDTMEYCNQGVAQGGIVDTPDEKWYAILFQDRGAVGRIPVIVPVTWNDNTYPVFGENGKIPAVVEVESTRVGYVYNPLVQSDDFKASDENDRQHFGTFGLKSCWQFNHEPDLSLLEINTDKGFYKIKCGKLCENVTQANNTITQRMTFPQCCAQVTVNGINLKDGDIAGLCILQEDYAFAAVTKKGDKFYAVMSVKNTSNEEVEAIELEEPFVELKAEADFMNQKDEVHFMYRNGNNWNPIGSVYKLRFALEHFTGNRVGLFAYAQKETGGEAEFSHFQIN